MRKVHINNLVPGAKLARDIFASDGRILLSAGIELRHAYIDKIKSLGISEVYIIDDISADINVRDVILQSTRLEAKQIVKSFLNDNSFTCTHIGEKVKRIIESIINELLDNDDIVINLSDIKSVDDYTFEHSVNVCILSIITGINLGYCTSRLRDLGVGALLHDIGKLKIPDRILKKPDKLTDEEFEEIKNHTVYGYEILRNNKSISMASAFIALGHHERCDGSGYPLQLKGENIHECARIVAVADVFDALTSDRVYRNKLPPHKVIDYIATLQVNHFDQKIVNCFIGFIAPFPVGVGVVLNTNEKGLVIKVSKKSLSRPTVRIIYDKSGEKLIEQYELDLLKQADLYIVDTCEL